MESGIDFVATDNTLMLTALRYTCLQPSQSMRGSREISHTALN
ncbi:MAG: hypothetical protein O2970_05080 [Proteobacteria bacterium]|nr:hypothetical protein [Pseudomonadota bacterium]